MICYASMTQGKRNLDAMRRHGWRVIVSPAHNTLDAQGFRYALDNGAWSYHQRGLPFDDDAFSEALCTVGADADFVVAPDIVCGGPASWEMSLAWLPRVNGVARVALLAVQDGFTAEQVAPHLNEHTGVFVGGSTEWKLKTMARWAALARAHGAWCHVGRVNTARRIHMCQHAGVTSFDGTSPTRFSKTTQKLTHAANQGSLLTRYQ